MLWSLLLVKLCHRCCHLANRCFLIEHHTDNTDKQTSHQHILCISTIVHMVSCQHDIKENDDDNGENRFSLKMMSCVLS